MLLLVLPHLPSGRHTMHSIAQPLSNAAPPLIRLVRAPSSPRFPSALAAPHQAPARSTRSLCSRGTLCTVQANVSLQASLSTTTMWNISWLGCVCSPASQLTRDRRLAIGLDRRTPGALLLPRTDWRPPVWRRRAYGAVRRWRRGARVRCAAEPSQRHWQAFSARSQRSSQPRPSHG